MCRTIRVPKEIKGSMEFGTSQIIQFACCCSERETQRIQKLRCFEYVAGTERKGMHAELLWEHTLLERSTISGLRRKITSGWSLGNETVRIEEMGGGGGHCTRIVPSVKYQQYRNLVSAVTVLVKMNKYVYHIHKYHNQFHCCSMSKRCGSRKPHRLFILPYHYYIFNTTTKNPQTPTAEIQDIKQSTLNSNGSVKLFCTT
jgi:hypothetical protein